jgi:hypothetical protein
MRSRAIAASFAVAALLGCQAPDDQTTDETDQSARGRADGGADFTCHNRCVLAAREAAVQCEARRGSDCATTYQAALVACARTCNIPPPPPPAPPSCRAACGLQASQNIDRCVRAGGDSGECRRQQQDALNACVAACPPVPPPPPPPPPTCEQACGQAAADAINACLRAGGDPSQCRLDAREATAACLARCPPRPTPPPPPPPPPRPTPPPPPPPPGR